MKPFIGIKKIWYGAVITAAVTPTSLKTWLASATEVKNSHQDTWGYAMLVASKKYKTRRPV